MPLGYGNVTPDGAVSASASYRPEWTRPEDNRLRELQQKRSAAVDSMTQGEVCELADLERRSDMFLRQGLRDMEKQLAAGGKERRTAQEREVDGMSVVSRRLCWDVVLHLLHEEERSNKAAMKKGQRAHRFAKAQQPGEDGAPAPATKNVSVPALGVLVGIMQFARHGVVTDADADAYAELKARVGALRLQGVDNALAIAARVTEAVEEAGVATSAAVLLRSVPAAAPEAVAAEVDGFMGFTVDAVPISSAAKLRGSGCVPAYLDTLPHPAGDVVMVGAAVEGAWACPFPPELTRPAAFEHPVTGSAECAMMHTQGAFLYASRPGWEQVAVLPLGAVEALVVLPDPTRSAIDSAEALAASWDVVVAPTKAVEGHIYLPRFDCSRVEDMSAVLSKCGCNALLGQGSSRALVAAHPFFVTEAGLGMVSQDGDAVSVRRGSAASPRPSLSPSKPAAADAFSKERFEMVCNRPFLFIVRHAGTNVVLAAAVVNHPLPHDTPPPTAAAARLGVEAQKAAEMNALFGEGEASPAALRTNSSAALRRRGASQRGGHPVLSPGAAKEGAEDLMDFLASPSRGSLTSSRDRDKDADKGGARAGEDFLAVLEGGALLPSASPVHAESEGSSSPSPRPSSDAASSPRVAVRKSRAKDYSNPSLPVPAAAVVAARRKRNSDAAAEAPDGAVARTVSAFSFVGAAGGSALTETEAPSAARASSFAFISGAQPPADAPFNSSFAFVAGAAGGATSGAEPATGSTPDGGAAAAHSTSAFSFVGAGAEAPAPQGSQGGAVVAARRKRGGTGAKVQPDAPQPAPSVSSAFSFVSADAAPASTLTPHGSFAARANTSVASGKTCASNPSFLKFESPARDRPAATPAQQTAEDLTAILAAPSGSALPPQPPAAQPAPLRATLSASVLQAWDEEEAAKEQLQRQRDAVAAQIAALQNQLHAAQAASADPPAANDSFAALWNEAAPK